MSNYNDFIQRVLANEGGYVDNPADPGGETNWGISKRAYPDLNIHDLTRQQAIDIYFRDFWQHSHADEFAPALGYQMLDVAVNHGVGNAERFLQRAVGVADDGIIGPVTVAAVNAMDVADVIFKFNAERLEFYGKLTTFKTFGVGWVRRVAAGLRFAAGDTP